MRGRTYFLIGMAVGLSALPVCCQPRKSGCGYNLVPVVVAAVDMPAGTVVTFEHISQRSVPEQFITSSVVKPDSASYVVNQKILVAVQAGDPLLWSQFETRKTNQVVPKMRSITIDVDPSRAFSGYLTPQDRVDVLMTMTDPQTHEPIAQTLIQSVLVLDVVARPAPGMTAVSLQVSPDEAEQLLLAQDVGKFALALRNREDTDVREEPRRTTVNALLFGARPKPGCRFPLLQVDRIVQVDREPTR